MTPADRMSDNQSVLGKLSTYPRPYFSKTLPTKDDPNLVGQKDLKWTVLKFQAETLK